MSLELFHAVTRHIKEKYDAEVTAMDMNTRPMGFVTAYARHKDGKVEGYNVKLSDLEDQPQPS